MQAVTDLRGAELAQVSVDVFDQMRDVVAAHLGKRHGHAFRRQLVVPFVLVIAVVARQHRAQVEVRLELRLLNQLPDLLLDDRQLRRVELLRGVVLVDEIVERRKRPIGIGGRHRRHQVIDDHRMAAALGLTAFARVVDDERIDERQVAEQRVGKALVRQPDALAGQPLERAVLADVHDRVRAPAALRDGRRQPSIERRVVMRRRQIGRVVDRVGIHAVAARRLERDDRVAEGHGRKQVVIGHRSTALSSAARAVLAALEAIFLSMRAVRAAQRVATVGRHSPPVFHAFPRRSRKRV